MSVPASLPPAARDALARGRTIEAIKIVRELEGIGLKQAKERVDAYRKDPAVFPQGHAGAPERRGHGLWIVVLVVGLLAWWWVRR